MSAPRGFITLTRADGTKRRVRASGVAWYERYSDGCTDVAMGAGTHALPYDETPEQIDALIAAAQGDAPPTPDPEGAETTREPLPPLVENVRERISTALRDTDWPDEAHLWFPTEEARALLAWLDRGRP